MRANQATLDRVRHFNKRVTNRILIHLCGRKMGHFAILGHTGRKSGVQYRIPIIAEPFQQGFVIAMTYGKKVDWYANVSHQGGCSLYWKKKAYDLVQPRLIDRETGLSAFPRLLRAALRRAGIEYFLQLDIRS